MREAIKDPDRLQHILEAISNVQEYIDGIDRETFDKDKVWLVITEDLEPLKVQVREYLSDNIQ